MNFIFSKNKGNIYELARAISKRTRDLNKLRIIKGEKEGVSPVILALEEISRGRIKCISQKKDQE